MRLTRREFLAATASALLSVQGIGALGGCAPDEPADDEAETIVDKPIVATLSYTSEAYSPVGNSSALMLAAGWHVFEGLYELDMHDFTPYPALASGEPRKLDELTYEVSLREGARFSDGSAVTASDVVNAFRRNLENDMYDGLIPFLDKESVREGDDGTIVFDLLYELGYPFETLFMNRISLVKVFPQACSDERMATLPVGTGPWRYDSIDGRDGGRIEFLPNEFYNGSLPATCTSMTWHIQLDEQERVKALEDGSSIVVEDVTRDYEPSLAHPELIVEMVPSFTLAFLMFNCRKPPFDDVRVRQAVLYSIDVDLMISESLAGNALPCTGFLPKTYADYQRASTVYSFDPDKAMMLLADAGVEGLSLEIRTCDNWVQGLAPRIVEDLGFVGIEATSVSMPVGELYADLTPEAAAEGTLPFDIVLAPGDPSSFGNDTDLLLSWWYDDPAWISGRTCWEGTDECEELRKLLESARREKDPGEQMAKWGKCFDIVSDNVPLYPLFHCDVSTAYDMERLEGFEPISTTGLMLLGATPR